MDAIVQDAELSVFRVEGFWVLLFRGWVYGLGFRVLGWV